MEGLKKKYIEYCLKLLDIPEIQEKIRKIIFGEENLIKKDDERVGSLKRKIEDLDEEKERVWQERDDYKYELEVIREESEKCKIKLEETRREKDEYKAKLEKVSQERDRYKYELEVTREDREKYKIELEKASQKIGRCEKELEVAEKDREVFIREYEVIKSEYETLKNGILDGLEIYNLYKSIDGNVKNELQEIFKGETFEDFLFNGAQIRNIDILWEISKKSIVEKTKVSEKVVIIFYYFFDRINRTYGKPMYEYLDIKIGERFNSTNQFSVGKASGDIKEILLKGYQDRSGKVIKKSIVVL